MKNSTNATPDRYTQQPTLLTKVCSEWYHLLRKWKCRRPCGLVAQQLILDRWSCLWGLHASSRGSQRKSCSQRPGYFVLPRALWLTLRDRHHFFWWGNQKSVSHLTQHLTSLAASRLLASHLLRVFKQTLAASRLLAFHRKMNESNLKSSTDSGLTNQTTSSPANLTAMLNLYTKQ